VSAAIRSAIRNFWFSTHSLAPSLRPEYAFYGAGLPMRINLREKLRFLHRTSDMSRTMAAATSAHLAASSAPRKPAQGSIGTALDLAQRYRRVLSLSPIVCFAVLYLAETLLPKPLSADFRNCVDLFRFYPMGK